MHTKTTSFHHRDTFKLHLEAESYVHCICHTYFLTSFSDFLTHPNERPLNLLVICLFHLWFSFLSNNTSLGRHGGILFLFFSPSWCVGNLTREYAQDSRKHNINFWFTADGSTALPRFSIQLFTLDVFWVRVVPLPDHWRFFLNVKTVH